MAEPVNYRTEVTRLVFFGRMSSSSVARIDAALRVSQNDDERRAELLCGELYAADLRGSDDVASNPNYKQVSNPGQRPSPPAPGSEHPRMMANGLGLQQLV